jgi:epoxyqueuosine reductase
MSADAADIPFAEVRRCFGAQGLEALAVLAPPGPLDDARFALMLADGIGDLAWLERTRDLRRDPARVLPGLRSIVATALPYQPEPGSGPLRRARYAAGKDYHRLLRMKLELGHRALEAAHGARWEHRAAADSAPLDERTLARRAGLGWLGRNALVIAPEAGTWRLLGFLLTTAPLAPHHAGQDADRCGSCRACETRCPTRALVDRRVLTERCISYLTIEHQGVIPRALAERFEGWWFGCDLCQEACPWNRFAGPAADPRLTGSDADAALLGVGAADFDAHFAGRAVRRIGYERFRRNLLCALASLGRRDECAALLAEGLPLVLAQARELEIGVQAGEG